MGRERKRDQRGTTAIRTLIGRAVERKITSREKKSDRHKERERRDIFVDIINYRSGVATSLRATVTRRVWPARKFVDMQSSFSLFHRFLFSASSSVRLFFSSFFFRPCSIANKFAGERATPIFGRVDSFSPGQRSRDCDRGSSAQFL